MSSNANTMVFVKSVAFSKGGLLFNMIYIAESFVLCRFVILLLLKLRDQATVTASIFLSAEMFECKKPESVYLGAAECPKFRVEWAP